MQTVQAASAMFVFSTDALRTVLATLTSTTPDIRVVAPGDGGAVVAMRAGHIGGVVVQVLGDGHCAFRCWSKVFTGSEDNHFDFRCVSVGYVAGDASLHNTLTVPLEVYQRQMLSRNAQCHDAWGDNPEMVALSKFYNMNVFVIQDALNLPYYELDVGSQRAICLAYQNKNHYNLVYFPEEGDGAARLRLAQSVEATKSRSPKRERDKGEAETLRRCLMKLGPSDASAKIDALINDPEKLNEFLARAEALLK